MKKLFRKKLDDKAIGTIRNKVVALGEAGEPEKIEKLISPLVKAQAEDLHAARSLLGIISDGHLAHEHAADLLFDVFNAHGGDVDLVASIGTLVENARDIDDLNAPPPDHPVFQTVLTRLSEYSLASHGQENEADIAEGLSTVTRHMARQYDDLAEKAYKRVVELLPTTGWAHYNLGLFYKTRGRFADGADANARAVEISEDPGQANYWNWGICATGAGDLDTALTIWKAQGNKIEAGRFNLPEGGYPSCKVRLAEFPLAERNKECDDPGREETIWIERLSPCHGIIRSVLVQNLGVDYGDVVLFDGAPYTYHTYGEKQIAVFPHLSTLLQRDFQIYDFAGTQEENGQLSAVSADLDRDAVVYVHTENYQILCSTCFRDPNVQHEKHETENYHTVTGRIAAPPDMDAKTLLDQIDVALKDNPQNRIFSPDLCLAAGQSDRARIEQGRFDILFGD